MIKRFVVCAFAIVLTSGASDAFAQKEELHVDSNAVVANSFWDNWFGQVSVNMNLQFPYGHNIKDVFPKGKSFGVNVAAGKWFSPEIGGLLKITWGNGIFENDHNEWLNPYGKPGKNHRTGGYISFLGDIRFNLHNLFGDYNPERKWNLIFAPRAGGWISIGSSEGAPVLGLSITNTYRLNNRWRLFADVGYHFISSINGPQSEGHGSNCFADINVGVEFDLSKENTFHKVSSLKKTKNDKKCVLNSFWDNWFAQAGVGMSLFNPYGTNFANVFPNGSTMGINFGIGKWFTPEFGLRGGLNWQNGIFENKHAKYLYPEEGAERNTNHGVIALYADVFLNIHNILGGYDKTRKWNAILYPRMGLVNTLSIVKDEECPVLGLGTEQSFRINDRLSVIADLTYQVATGGIVNSDYHTDNTGSNGWFDISVGVQYELGQTIGWNKPGEKRTTVVTTGHNWPRFAVNTIGSVGVAFVGKSALKAMIKEERPDHSDNKSFPSGHASMAFAAARSLDKEFRKESIWIPIAGYAAATAVGIERVANKHHHWYDVVAGAAVGVGSAELTWWLSDKLFGKGSNITVGSSGNTVDVSVRL